MERRYIWCLTSHKFVERSGIFNKIKLPKHARCPDCGKQFKISIQDVDGDQVAYLPAHKKAVKTIG